MREYDVKIFAIVKSLLPREAMPAAVAKVRSGPKTGVQIASENVSRCISELKLDNEECTEYDGDSKEQTKLG